MKPVVFCLVAAAVVAWSQAPAAAGPIHDPLTIAWSYEATGGSLGDYALSAVPLTFTGSREGEWQAVPAFSDFAPKVGSTPEAVGPITSQVRITDQNSGRTTDLAVSYYLWSLGAADGPVSPHLLPDFHPDPVVLGYYKYSFKGEDDRLLVSVSPVETLHVPEPSGIALGVIGLVVAAAKIERRSSRKAYGAAA